MTAWIERLRKIRHASVRTDMVQIASFKTAPRLRYNKHTTTTAVRPPSSLSMNATVLRCRQSKHNVQAHRENTGMNFQAPGLVLRPMLRTRGFGSHACSLIIYV